MLKAYPLAGRIVLSLGVCCTLSFCAGHAAAASTIQVQVSRALAEDWHGSISATPGDAIDVRVLISWTGGPQTPLGFSSCIFQPTVSNWATGLDTAAPFVNNGIGSQYTTPIGAVPDSAGQYGRVMPFAARRMDSVNRIFSHVNTVGDTSYLRIAQRQVTSWFGSAGNTSGGSGVNLHQPNIAGPERDLFPSVPFEAGLVNLVMFKFSITLGVTGPANRVLVADVPLVGVSDQSTIPYVGWYGTPTEPIGSIRDMPTIIPAFIQVPATGFAALAAGTGMLVTSRRRRPLTV